MLSDNRGTYVSRISTHNDIAPATNHNKQHYILIIMQQNCQITRCARQHTMDSVLKSAKLLRDLTGNRNGFTHARSALCGRVSPKLDERLGDKFANRISNNLRFRHFRHNRNYTKLDSDRWSYRPVNCICTKKYTVYCGSCRFSAGVEASVTWPYGILAMAAIVCWQSEADCAESKSEANVWNTPD